MIAVPDWIRANARQGLEWYEEGLGGDGLVDRTIREARDMAAGRITEDKVVRMAAWLARHMTDLDAPDAKPGADGYPSPGVVANALWGGGPKSKAERAAAWARARADEIDKEASMRTNRFIPAVKAAVDATRAADAVTAAAFGAAAPASRWRGVIALEGVETGDRRMFSSEALSWDIPGEGLPLMAMFRNPEGGGGHDGAERVGRITRIERVGNAIVGEGDFDMDSPAGQEAARLVSEGWMRGVSVDLDSVRMQLVFPPGAANSMMEDPQTDDDGNFVVEMESPLMRITSGRVRGATLCSFPAFAEVSVGPLYDDTLVASSGRISVMFPLTVDSFAVGDEADVCTPCVEDALVAAAVELRPSAHTQVTTDPPPAAWFAMPSAAELEELRSMAPSKIVTADGRIYGYAARWGSCHTGFAGRCVTPPRSRCNYAKFRTGSVLAANGDVIATGRVFLGGEHASVDRRLNPQGVMDHYAATSVAVADVVCYDDDFGMVFAGYVRPGTTREQVVALRASDISPDWRDIDRGGLECLALLAVNASGFVVPALAASSGMQVGWELDDEEPYALVAGGALRPARRATQPVADSRVAALESRLARMEMQLHEMLRDDAEAYRDQLLAAVGTATPTQRRDALLASIIGDDE